MRGELVSVLDLSGSDRASMLALMHEHYAGVHDAAFERDLAEKSHALLLLDQRSIVGFSTLQIFDHALDARRVRVVFSGDTIVRRSCWGGLGFLRSWLVAVRGLGLLGADTPAYWLLLAGGTRTYKTMPSVWKRYTPSADRREPGLESLAASICAERFGTRYDPRRGVVRFDHPYTLRESLLEPEDPASRDRHADHFRALNPGHTRGDDLVCLTELSPANLTAVGRRLLRDAG